MKGPGTEGGRRRRQFTRPGTGHGAGCERQAGQHQVWSSQPQKGVLFLILFWKNVDSSFLCGDCNMISLSLSLMYV